MVKKTSKNPKAVLKEGAMNLYEEFKDSLLAFVGEFLEVQIRSLSGFIANLPKIKQRVKRSLTSFIIAFSGFILLLFGFSDYLASTLDMAPEVMRIISGTALIVVAYIYSKN